MVEIVLNENAINSNSATNVALTMLHEALHAKLIAEYYDEVGNTNYRGLYQRYQGWGLGDIDKNQEYEMITNYADQMAQALKDFEATQGIYRSLDFYKEALKYDFSIELELDTYKEGEEEYNTLAESSKNCN